MAHVAVTVEIENVHKFNSQKGARLKSLRQRIMTLIAAIYIISIP